MTFNVLVFDEEMAAVEARVRQMAQAGVDAVIVQVGGVCMIGGKGRRDHGEDVCWAR